MRRDTYDYVITIKNGEMSGILPAVRSDFDISGKVLATGDIKDMEASRFGQGMTFSGKFIGDVAEGNFDADSICGGMFRFTRKK